MTVEPMVPNNRNGIASIMSPVMMAKHWWME